MKFVKFIAGSTNKVQEYHYVCSECGVTKIFKQAKNYATELCFACSRGVTPRKKNPLKYDDNGKYIRESKYICCKCGGEFVSTSNQSRSKARVVTTCVRCSRANPIKRGGTTSKYIGVAYQKSSKGFKGYWHGKMIYKHETIFFCKYLDDDVGTNEEKQTLCAIQRELFIIDKNLPHKRNFTDTDLEALKVKFIKKGLL